MSMLRKLGKRPSLAPPLRSREARQEKAPKEARSHQPLSRHPFPSAGSQPASDLNDWHARDPHEGCGGMSGAVRDYAEGVRLEDTVHAHQVLPAGERKPSGTRAAAV